MIKKKLLYKMVTLYLAIVLLYTVFAGSLTLHKELQIYSLKDHHTNSLYTNQIKNYADAKIDLALKFMHKTSTLPSMLDYRHSTEDNYIFVTDVYNELQEHLRGFTQFGFSIGVINGNSDIVISPDGTLKYERYLNELGITDDSLKDLDAFFAHLDGSNTFVVPQSLMRENSNLIIMIQRMNDRLNSSSVYYFTVLDSHSILPPQLKDSNSSAISIYKDDLIYALSNPSEIDQEEVFHYIEDNSVSKNMLGLKLGGLTSYIYQSDVVPGLQYIYTINDISTILIFLGLLKSIIIPSLIFFLVGLFVVYRATKTSYEPITQLLNLVDNSHSSNFLTEERVEINELDYIRKGFEKIHSDNHNLQNRLESSLVSLQEDFFRKILFSIEDESFIHKNLSKLSLDSFRHNLVLVLFELEGLSTLTKMVPIKDLTNIIKNTMHTFSRVDKGMEFVVLPLDYKKYCIVTHNLNCGQVEKLSIKIIDSVRDNLKLDAAAYISSTYDLNNLSSAFQEVLMLNKEKDTVANEPFITTGHMDKCSNISYYYPLEAETYLINYVSTNELSKAQDLLTEILQRNIVERKIDSDTLTHLKYSLLDTFKRCLNTVDSSLSQFNKEYGSLLNDFIQAPTSEIEEACSRLFDELFNYCNEDKFSLENPTASNIFMYIHEHFEKDISLTDIANQFDLSTSYISKLFKSSVGVNFKKYVNKLKIQKSKELLATGNYKVSEAADLVGFNSVNTFIRVFKQYETISPGEYMKNLDI